MNQLKYSYFVEVARHLSLSKAADALFISQPALSRHIAALEKELDLQLFYREPHGLRLTPGGNLFLKEYKKIQTHFENLLTEARNANSGKTGLIRLGIQEGHDVDDILTKAIHTFLSLYPSIELDVICASHNALMEQLISNNLDIGIMICFNAAVNDCLCSRILRKRQSYIILNVSHPLAKKENFQFRDLESETLMITNPDVAIDGVEFTKATCRRLGIHPKKVRLAPSYSTLYIWLSMNEGFTISDENAYFKNQNLKFYPLPSEASSTQVAYWAKNSRSPSTMLFLDYLSETLRSQ